MRWWDIELVLQIERSVFAGEPPWSPEQFWAELAGVPDRRSYLVAEQAGNLVGYAGVSLAGDVADVMTIAVDPTHRRAGIGRALLGTLLERAQEAGAREVFLEVRADNGPAVRMYESTGFTVRSRRRGYYAGGVDALVMRRRAPKSGSAGAAGAGAEGAAAGGQ